MERRELTEPDPKLLLNSLPFSHLPDRNRVSIKSSSIVTDLMGSPVKKELMLSSE